MATFHVRNQIVFRAPTRVGLLSDVAERLEGAGVNVLAVRGYEEGDEGVVLIDPDDSRAAMEALATLDGRAATMPMIVAEVPNTPGQLAAVALTLSNANVNVSQLYATASPGCAEALIVLDTSDNVRALEALQKL